MRSYLRRKIIQSGCKLASHEFFTGEKLPWRRRHTPYRIFLAEMLLVRTRVDVVARLYDDILGQYPNIYALAQADENELHETLRPLGLSKRIPYIVKAAQHICKEHKGKIPSDVESLLKIPGVGIYTASAIATFAYGQAFVPADVNILRFVARLTGLEMEHKTKGSKQLREMTPFLAESYTGLIAEKLLDFTRLICCSRNPLCGRCPLTRSCRYFREGKQCN